jgi:hypothetical protein
MKLSTLLLPVVTLFATGNALAASDPLKDYLSCGPQSFPVIAQEPFKSLVPSKQENGRITLQGGTKSETGQRWVFDKPVVVSGLSLTGFFADDMDLMGSRVINWGFYVQQTPEQVAASLKKSHSVELLSANGVLARPEVWSEKQSKWLSETSGDTAGKLVTDTSERVFMVEPAPADLSAGSKAMVTCSVQGKISDAALKSTRPDLR